MVNVNPLHSGYPIQWGNKDFSVIWITMMTLEITESGKNQGHSIPWLFPVENKVSLNCMNRWSKSLPVLEVSCAIRTKGNGSPLKNLRGLWQERILIKILVVAIGGKHRWVPSSQHPPCQTHSYKPASARESQSLSLISYRTSRLHLVHRQLAWDLGRRVSTWPIYSRSWTTRFTLQCHDWIAAQALTKPRETDGLNNMEM